MAKKNKKLRLDKKTEIKEVAKLLSYLNNEAFNLEERGIEFLITGMGFNQRTLKLCNNGEYTKEYPNDYYEITADGISFLEKYYEKRSREENTKITTYLTTQLVITTIAALFNSAKLISPKLLIILYGVASLAILIYFKISKNIKL